MTDTESDQGTPAPRFFRARAVFDGVSGKLIDGVGLLVENGRVTAVGPENELVGAAAASAGVEIVDLGDAFVVPGFVDSHTHVTIRPGEGNQHWQLVQPAVWQTIRGVENLRRMLRSGVTTARTMTEEHDIDFEFRDAIARGEVVGPRLLVSGPGMSPPGGHGSAAGGVAGVGPLREGVQKRAERGANHIKIFTTGGVSSAGTSLGESNYSAEEIAAIVDEAAKYGLTVGAHAHGGPGVDLPVENGIHTIEHGALLTDQNVARMDAAGTWLVLTHTILFHPEGIEQGDAAEPSIIAKVMEARASVEAGIHRILESRIPVALGTDSMHGYLGFEAEWLVAHGWTPSEALLALTRNGGRLLEDETTGTLASGSRADFVVLGADPLADIRAVYDVVSVYRDGRLVVAPDGTLTAIAVQP
ncbi:MAG: Imidazolonepropionase [Subtercola sp.]|nr:Imidazolonepropionase [Subtercola sp.]